MIPRILVLSLLGATATSAATYVCDPANGAIGNPGTEDQPWPAIEAVIAKGLLPTGAKTPDSIVQPGDTVLLRTGYHGRITIPGGNNAKVITIAAAPGATPDLSHVVIRDGARWSLRGLRISPSLAPSPLPKPPRHLVQLGEKGGPECAELVIEDCFIFNTLDSSAWTAADWVAKPVSGIWLGRHGRGHIARNNHILNTRMGMDICAPECLVEGNIIDRFSGDAIRVTRDGIVVRHNIITNNFVSDKDGDKNHDDGIQCFLFNKGRGLVRNVTIVGNIILERSEPGLPLTNSLQGIGFFDGPLENFVVQDNVVRVNAYHGVAVYDGQGCSITGNVCLALDPDSKSKPWVMLGQKRQLAKGNTVTGNHAHSFNFKADAAVTAADNEQIDPAIFQKRQSETLALINRKFGPTHPVSKQPRLTP